VAERGEADHAAAALDEGHAEQRLELADAGREGRLRDVRGVGGAAEVAVFVQRHEVLQLLDRGQVDAHSAACSGSSTLSGSIRVILSRPASTPKPSLPSTSSSASRPNTSYRQPSSTGSLRTPAASASSSSERVSSRAATSISRVRILSSSLSRSATSAPSLPSGAPRLGFSGSSSSGSGSTSRSTRISRLPMSLSFHAWLSP